MIINESILKKVKKLLYNIKSIYVEDSNDNDKS